MANGKQIARGLEILGEFRAQGTEALSISAQRDQLFAGGDQFDDDPAAMPEPARKELEALGWFWDDEVECWSHFT